MLIGGGGGWHRLTSHHCVSGRHQGGNGCCVPLPLWSGMHSRKMKKRYFVICCFLGG